MLYRLVYIIFFFNKDEYIFHFTLIRVSTYPILIQLSLNDEKPYYNILQTAEFPYTRMKITEGLNVLVAIPGLSLLH